MLRVLVFLVVLSGCAGELSGGIAAPPPPPPVLDGGAFVDGAGRPDAVPVPDPDGQAAPALDAQLAPDSSVEPDTGPPAPLTPKRLGLGGIVGGPCGVSQPYGPTSFWMDYSYCKAYGTWPAGQNVHCATDIAIPRGTPLFAAEDATVITAGGTPYFKDDLNPAAGELRLKLADGTHVIYGHCSQVEVSKGATVKVGQRIGQSGSAGTGAHLHLEVRVPDGSFASGFRTVDPEVFFGP